MNQQEKALWLLRAIADFTMIVVGWFATLNYFGWSAALLLAAYCVLWGITTFEVHSKEEMSMYDLPDGKRFYGTKKDFDQFLPAYLKEIEKVKTDGEASRTEDEV
ncbi:hypothetical protein KC678_00185 [Candidatus Dojkabacteria bacterium]|uniref:Uncharacterized protein n=1 Tax=Candidatus Dojkabacteria bacterium TaxID=2099670 RepID=A0A955IAI2_9BACT|nr:hypothetical protein [Candidatus Dojkabacteria bacterium]